ncbi:uncharacterized protein K02A2.6-like [Prunus avium]|uniref:Uncharacterized protein K02A2.6-like n=1 Tax=Prunus avium TaxID=42229 RepID=A0A6P5TV90_PRUAV|nr:uncharacterized protein K02A2.6-like [Prunus avium]
MDQHAWILVATDYFTKWVEAESYQSISSAQVVKFFENHIVHKFGIPETITADNGPVFASAKTREYTERMGIKLIHSTPYYPQSNGQAEVSNKVIKGILEKMIEDLGHGTNCSVKPFGLTESQNDRLRAHPLMP